MARSVADICNKALSRIGIKNYIDDLAADQTEEAETANVFYEDTRDLLLSAYPWPFATLRQTLAVKGDEAARDGWANVFALPADCLQTRKIWPVGQLSAISLQMSDLFPPNGVWSGGMNPRTPRSNQRPPFEIEKSSTDDSSVLLSDMDSPVLFYTARVVDPSTFHPMFVDALAWLLAAEMAMPLAIDLKREEMARKRFELSVQRALGVLFNGQQADEEPVSEMIAGRR